ncbi:hypothetical protein CSOJ01_10195 [Colletotrichum sojae]|uniref:Uncharacterized protein n=1 Tax=Colletotrichum sojae TaxID=2175907 RepID=A0A8H6MQF2_9PEZI|nr:hypothetical protein CSOJ01_10195 [Colletotrichum sojae]
MISHPQAEYFTSLEYSSLLFTLISSFSSAASCAATQLRQRPGKHRLSKRDTAPEETAPHIEADQNNAANSQEAKPLPAARSHQRQNKTVPSSIEKATAAVPPPTRDRSRQGDERACKASLPDQYIPTYCLGFARFCRTASSPRQDDAAAETHKLVYRHFDIAICDDFSSTTFPAGLHQHGTATADSAVSFGPGRPERLLNPAGKMATGRGGAAVWKGSAAAPALARRYLNGLPGTAVGAKFDVGRLHILRALLGTAVPVLLRSCGPRLRKCRVSPGAAYLKHTASPVPRGRFLVSFCAHEGRRLLALANASDAPPSLVAETGHKGAQRPNGRPSHHGCDPRKLPTCLVRLPVKRETCAAEVTRATRQSDEMVSLNSSRRRPQQPPTDPVNGDPGHFDDSAGSSPDD